jgi:hypothetical protein
MPRTVRSKDRTDTTGYVCIFSASHGARDSRFGVGVIGGLTVYPRIKVCYVGRYE